MSTPGALRVVERDFIFFKRIWRAVVLGSIIQPLMYLLGVGIGVGTLVDRGADSTELLGGVSYFAFYATAIVATSAMFVASQEALWPTMDGFTWSNAYRAATSTPLTPTDVALGLMIHYAVRSAITSSGVAVVLLLFDETRTAGLLAVIPFGVLTGLAFAAPCAAWTADPTDRRVVPGDHPLRDHPDVPVRRRVLPGRATARLVGAGRLDHTAVARRRTVPRCRARRPRRRFGRAPRRRAGIVHRRRIPRRHDHLHETAPTVSERLRGGCHHVWCLTPEVIDGIDSRDWRLDRPSTMVWAERRRP